jgi:hypothetical protein
MALRVAVANGNWSNPATWNGGVLPSAGDIVASNNFTVTIDVNINVDSITNAAQAVGSAVPNMTSNTTPSGIVTASQSETGTFAAFNAFGGDFNTEWRPTTAATISYEFTSPKAIDQYGVGAYAGATASWTFQGWNGSTWVTIHTVTSSATGYTSPLLGNSIAYIKYRLNYASDPGRVHTIQFYEYLGTSPAVAGGTFILNDGVTVTCTNTGDGVSQVANIACLIVNNTGSSIINANIRGRDGSFVRCIRKTGTGNFTINGALRGQLSSAGNGGALEIANTGTVTVNGSVFAGPAEGSTIYVGSTCTLNIIGDIISGFLNNNFTVDVAANNCQLNITGNIVVGSQAIAGWTSTVFRITGSGNTLTLVGNIDATLGINSGSSVYKYGLSITGVNCVVMHTGNIIGTSDNVSGTNPVNITNTVYYNQVGYIKASMNFYGLYSTSASSIHLLTGPFISSPVGIQPFYVARMHYRRTIGSYYEFRNNSTNGALPPAASAPATRLVSPDTIADSPIPANVRQGTVYSLGSQTGTMIVPSPSNVANNVPVDNTVGTAVLDPNAIWAVPLTSINTLNSIGRRVKNAATVETTGAQIQTTLNNNE